MSFRLTAAIGIAILQAAFSNFKHNGTQVYAFGGGVQLRPVVAHFRT